MTEPDAQSAREPARQADSRVPVDPEQVEQALEALWRGDATPFDDLLNSGGPGVPRLLEGLATARGAEPIGPGGQAKIGGYSLKRVIGRGGMGTVYLAIQEHPRRPVALKVMRSGVASRGAMHRFEHEAQVLARLRHPNIAQIYEAGRQMTGEADESVPYFAMEYIPRAKPITDYVREMRWPLRPRLELFLKVCDAVRHGHQKGVIHRDLKPGNILVDGSGEPKIIDFGVARSTDSDMAVTTLQTDIGQLLGTLQYMSPEQCEADPHALDSRSDVYALAVVLFELLCERLPYDVRHVPMYEAARLIREAEPPRPSTIDRALRGDIGTIMLRALEKQRERRYQSAADLMEDIERYLNGEPILARPPGLLYVARKKLLRLLGRGQPLAGARWHGAAPATGWSEASPRRATAGTSGDKIMLAVLPFENLSGDREQEYFSDGMTEEMIAQLSRLQPRQLGVIARTSVMHYKEVRKTAAQIGQELGVAYILEGSVRRADDRVRITAQLIEVSDGAHVWADSFDRELQNVLALQSEVAQAIARALQIELLTSERHRLANVRPVNPEAHDAYLKGRYCWNIRSEVELERSIRHYRDAIDEDPQYALPHAGLADTLVVLAGNGHVLPGEALRTAKSEALKALEMDRTLVQVHASLAAVTQHLDWDWPRAEREYHQAIELNPGYATVHHWYAEFLMRFGRLDEALLEVERAQELDPLSLILIIEAGCVHWWAGRVDRAVAEAQRAIALDRHFAYAHWLMARVRMQQGAHEEAIEGLRRAVEISGGDPKHLAELGCAYAQAGMNQEALKILQDLSDLAGRRYVAPSLFGWLCAALGRLDIAFEWLEKACDQRDTVLTAGPQLDPIYDPIRDDPRFGDILRRVGRGS